MPLSGRVPLWFATAKDRRFGVCKQAPTLTNRLNLELFSRISELLVVPQRQSMRASLQVSVAGREEMTSFAGVSRNISISGMLLETDQQCNRGPCAVGIGSRGSLSSVRSFGLKSSVGRFRYG
jgi:hypothetical protein